MNTPIKHNLPLTPMKGEVTAMNTLDQLLKKPATVVHGLAIAEVPKLRLWLVIIGAVAMLVFGLVIGSFSGGMQWWAAPLKISVGQVCAAVLCLPSLYVFVSMSGADQKFPAVMGLLIAASALMGVLLATFSPVIWLFSQSTDSIGFMTILCLLIWAISAGFAVNFLHSAFQTLGESPTWHLRVWVMIFTLVSLQMVTALRPILGKPETTELLPQGKMSFLEHFFKTIGPSSGSNSKNPYRD